MNMLILNKTIMIYNRCINKKSYYLYFLRIFICIIFLLASCADKSPETFPEKAYIRSFKVNNVLGNIDVENKIITLYFNDNVDLSDVTPVVEVVEGATYSPQGSVDLTKPVTYVATFGDKSTETTYTVNAVIGEGPKLVLDANRVFFSPCGTLKNHEKSGEVGDEYNGNKYFDYTFNWKNINDTLVWPVDIKYEGKLTVTPILGVPENQNGSVVEVIVEDTKKNIVLTSTGGYDKFAKQETVSFDISTAGRYTVKIKISSMTDESVDVAYVKSIELGGNSVLEASPVLLRWRPAAVHCAWNNSNYPDKIEMAIHEVTVKSDFIDSYSPITAPFGYFGSTWVANEEKFGGINFSLWSFSAGATPPPTEKFSHLIAVGGEDSYIDGFNHEGTGVKRRGPNPYDKMVGERTQALAMKKIPGKPYNIYYSYYWDTNKKEWILFGCGKEYNDKDLKYLSTGAFVEQPGASNVQRSCHIKRNIEFRGWYIDKNKNIYPIDKMVPSGGISNQSYKNWTVTEDGKFSLQMGGLDPLLTEMPKEVLLGPDKGDLPEYLSSANLASFDKLPVTIEVLDATEIQANSAVLNFKVDDFGTNPEVRVYWGENDGLTFVEGNVGNGGVVKWQFNQLISPASTTFSHKLDALKPNTKYYYRIQIKNNEGETWAWDTETFTTLEGEMPEDVTAELSFKATGGHLSQEGNIISFDNPFDGYVNVGFIVKKYPEAYPWNMIGQVVRNDNMIKNIRVSLDGSETEVCIPDSKAASNFVSTTIEKVNSPIDNVFSKMRLEWIAKAKKENSFIGNYVANGGFFQYDISFALLGVDGSPIYEDKEKTKPCTVTLTFKTLNRNNNAKAISMKGLPDVIKKSDIPVGGYDITSNYDGMNDLQSAFGSEMPSNITWLTLYWTGNGLFQKKIINDLPAYQYMSKDLGGVTVSSDGKLKLHISQNLQAGEYMFKFIAKDSNDTKKYAIFYYKFTLVE